MKACKHYQLFSKETEITPSENAWNAWVQVYEGTQLYYSTFRAGLFYEYLMHLLENKRCRRQTGITKEKVQKLLKKIEKEWEEFTK